VWARKDDRIQSQSGHLPQAIAHRGYKAVYPENTMKAFEGAVAVGTHAIETDIHLSKDDVVVLSHVSHALPPVSSYNQRGQN
jgi:glycerophosphoryl diester phosphodiesterase